MPRKGSKLKTAFYVWFRTHAVTFARLTLEEDYSHRIAALELGWKRNADMKLARELVDRHLTQFRHGDWSGVERDLFGAYNYYEKLPSVQEAFRKVGDPRAGGVAATPKLRAPAKPQPKLESQPLSPEQAQDTVVVIAPPPKKTATAPTTQVPDLSLPKVLSPTLPKWRTLAKVLTDRITNPAGSANAPKPPGTPPAGPTIHNF